MLKKFFAIGSTIFIKFLSVFIAIYINRWLTNPDNLLPSELRQFNLILVYNSILLGILSLGIPSLVQKFYTIEKDEKKYSTFWTTILILQSFLYILGLFLIVLIFSFSNIQNLALFLSLFTMQYVLQIDGNFRSICDTFGRSWQFSLTDFFAKLVIFFLLLISGFVKLSIPYINYFVYASVYVYVIQFFVDWFWQRKYTLISKFDFSIIKDNLNFFLYTGLISLLIGLYSTTDKWFIDFFGYSEYVLNGYSIAFKIIETLIIIPSLSVPIIASMAKKEVDNYLQNPNLFQSKILDKIRRYPFFKNLNNTHYIYVKWLLVSLFIGVFSSLILFVFKEFIISVIDSQRIYFKEAKDSLSILLYTLVPVSIIFYINLILIFLNKEKQSFFIMLFITIFTIILYYFLISEYGHIGAAIASLISISIDSIIRLFFFYKTVRRI